MGNTAFMGGLTSGLAQGLQQAQASTLQREMQELMRKEIKLKSQLQELALDRAVREQAARKAVGLAQSGVGFGAPGGPEEFAAFDSAQVPFAALGQMSGGQAVVQKPPMSLADMAADAQMQQLLLQAGGPYEDVVKSRVQSDLAARQFREQIAAMGGLGGAAGSGYYPEVSIVDGKPGVRFRASDYEMVEVTNPDGSKSRQWVQKPMPGSLPMTPAGALGAPGGAPAPMPSAGAPAAGAGVVTEPSPLDVPLGKEAARYVNPQGQTAAPTDSARQAVAKGYGLQSAAQEEGAKVAAKGAAESAATSQEAIAGGQQMLKQIDEILVHPQLPFAVGIGGALPPVTYINSDAIARLEQIQGGVFLQAYQRLKGGGQITEVEGRKAEAAIGRLNRAQSLKEIKNSLTELRGVIANGLKRLEAKASGGGATAPVVDFNSLPP